MARYARATNSFAFGEVSPANFGRADADFYKQMCEKVKNMIPKAQGGVIRRPGHKYLPETFGDAQINDYSASGSIVKLIPASFSYDKQSFLIMNTGYLKRYSVNNIPYGGTSHIGAVTSLSTSKIFGTDWVPTGQLEQWAQYGNLLVVTNGTYPPMFVAGLSSANEKFFLLGEGKLTSLGTLATTVTEGWTLLPFDPINSTSTTFAVSNVAIGTSRTLTASAAVFTSGMVGMYARMHTGATVGHVLITGYTSSTQVTVTVLSTIPPAFDATTPSASANWALSQWGGSARGWPRTCAFYKERLYFGGNAYMQDGIWGSEIGDLYQFSLLDPTASLTASDPFNVRIGQSDTKFINHLFPKENLFANMETKEAYLSPIDKDVSISALNTEVSSHSSFGAAQIQPAALYETLVYLGLPPQILSTVGRKLLEIEFNPKDERYSVEDLSFFTEEITRDRCIGASTLTARPYFVAMAVCKKPVPAIWVLDSTGRLYSVTRNKKSNTVAWAHHPVGGTYLSTDAKVIDIISCDDQLVLATLRNTGGNADQVCYEIMSEEFAGATLDYGDPIFLDYCLSATVTTGAISGLNHLNGNTVHALVGGEYLGTYTVSGNAITVGTSYNGQVAYVGYNYESLVVPSALETNALFGSGLGAVKRTESATVFFERTVAAKVGIVGSESVAEEIQFRQATDIASDPIPLFTGEKEVLLSGDYERKQNLYILQDKPFPMNVNYMIAKGLLYD